MRLLRTIGIALLAVAWMIGLSWYDTGSWVVWALLVVAGVSLMTGSLWRLPGRVTSVVGAVLLLPAVLVAPWPYVLGPLLLLVGLAFSAVPGSIWWRVWPASCGLVGGSVLVAQGLAMWGYECVTARSHELPWPLPTLLGGVAELLGLEAGVYGSTVTLGSMRRIHRLGATWELFLDPASLCMIVGVIVVLALRVWANAPSGRRLGRFVRSGAAFLAAMVVWLFVRSGLLMAVYLHRVLRTGYDDPLEVVDVFWNYGVHLGLLAVPVALAWRFARVPSGRAVVSLHVPTARHWRRPAAALLAALAVSLVVAGVCWDPVGVRKPGRVIVDEHKSGWESTTRPYDTEWYEEDDTLGIGQESGYNYAVLYDYSSHFYRTSRLFEPVTDEVLRDCDVFIIKCPTERYSVDEIAAIRRFVYRGGGLLLIGEHTNYKRMGTYLNDILQYYGARFRYDCLFGIPSAFDQEYRVPLVPHPIIQRMPRLDFAISASIEPELTRGRSVIRGTGLKSLPADYHALVNYYPQVEDQPEMRYGAFVELWTTRHGQGRVAAFGDSTILSNFSFFEPGKSEMTLGMIEWLNHRNRGWDPRWPLVGLGAVLLMAAFILARRWPEAWVVLLGAGLLGWAVSVVGVRELHAAAMPGPAPLRDYTLVAVDRTTSDVRLSESGFVKGREGEFALFERWILRLGYFTSRRSGRDVFGDGVDVALFLYPSKVPDTGFLGELERFVRRGGKVLVLDGYDNGFPLSEAEWEAEGARSILEAVRVVNARGLERETAANVLLEPFGLSVGRPIDYRGPVELPSGWPSIPVELPCEVHGGRPLARAAGRPVAASVRHGKGTVTVVGFGRRFCDYRMGVVSAVVPDEKLRKVFDVQFTLFPVIVEDRIPALPEADAAHPAP
jgi:hypothetical protein